MTSIMISIIYSVTSLFKSVCMSVSVSVSYLDITFIKCSKEQAFLPELTALGLNQKVFISIVIA